MNLGPRQEGWPGWGFSDSGERAPSYKDAGQREEMNREKEMGMEGSVSAPTPCLFLPAPFSASTRTAWPKSPLRLPLGPAHPPHPAIALTGLPRSPLSLSNSSIFITSKSHIVCAWK